MIRLGLILTLLLAAMPAAGQVTGAIDSAAVPTLKRTVHVHGDLVRIGDLVSNAGGLANVPIFRSPDVGSTGTIQAYRVVEAARARGLTEIDTDSVVEIVVTRESRTIPIGEIQTRIANILAVQYGAGDPKTLLISLDRGAQPIQVETGFSTELQASRVNFDPRSGRFDISFQPPAGVRPTSVRFTGSAVDTIEVAILQRALGRGDLIKAEDISVERRPKAEAGADATTVDRIVGMAARRTIRVGQIMKTADVMKPEIVRRNEAVTLVFEIPGLLLTVRGKANDAGGVGDVINVMNLQSKRIVQGVITAPGRVDVVSAMPPAILHTAFTNPSEPAVPRGQN